MVRRTLRKQIGKTLGSANYIQVRRVGALLQVPLIASEEGSKLFRRVREALDKWLADNNFVIDREVVLPPGGPHAEKVVKRIGTEVDWSDWYHPSIQVQLIDDGSVVKYDVEQLIRRLA